MPIIMLFPVILKTEANADQIFSYLRYVRNR